MVPLAQKLPGAALSYLYRKLAKVDNVATVFEELLSHYLKQHSKDNVQPDVVSYTWSLKRFLEHVEQQLSNVWDEVGHYIEGDLIAGDLFQKHLDCVQQIYVSHQSIFDQGSYKADGKPIEYNNTVITVPILDHLQLFEEDNSAAIIDILGLKNGGMSTCRDQSYETPLMVACRYNAFHTAKRLLGIEPSCIDAQDVSGWTALMYAARVGSVELLKLLLERGADVNRADFDGLSALQHACHERRKQCVGFLLEQGASMSHRDDFGCTACHFAVQSGSLGLVETLLTHTDEHVWFLQDVYGNTPLHFAALLNRVLIFKTLSSRFASKWNQVSVGGLTAEQEALYCGNLSVIKNHSFNDHEQECASPVSYNATKNRPFYGKTSIYFRIQIAFPGFYTVKVCGSAPELGSGNMSDAVALQCVYEREYSKYHVHQLSVDEHFHHADLLPESSTWSLSVPFSIPKTGTKITYSYHIFRGDQLVASIPTDYHVTLAPSQNLSMCDGSFIFDRARKKWSDVTMLKSGMIAHLLFGHITSKIDRPSIELYDTTPYVQSDIEFCKIGLLDENPLLPFLSQCPIIRIFAPTLRYEKEYDSTLDIALYLRSGTRIGTSHIVLREIQPTMAYHETPILCQKRHIPIGILRFETFLTLPMKQVHTMALSDQGRQLDRSMDLVGHRGSGSTFEAAKSQLRHSHMEENTMLSFEKAFQNGAKAIEFDVQLTLDCIPIIHHDYRYKIKTGDTFISTPVNQMSFKEFLKFREWTSKTYYRQGIEDGKQRRSFASKALDDSHIRKTAKDEHAAHKDHLSYPKVQDKLPTLVEVLKKLPESCPCNIEIKYPSLEECETHGVYFGDRNKYVDTILYYVFENVSERPIFFSCFDPQVAYLLHMKQKRYPVFLLTTGGRTNHFNPQLNSLRDAVMFASHFYLFGVVSHSEILLQEPHLGTAVRQHALTLCTYGEANNHRGKVRFQLDRAGVDVVIADVIPFLSSMW